MVKMAASDGVGVGYSRSKNSRIRNEVVNMYKSFVSEVEPRDVLDLLIQKRVISIERKDEVMSKQTRQDRCRALLDQLFSCSHDGAFVVLRQALERNYHWIVERIDESKSGEGIRGKAMDFFQRLKKPKQTEAVSQQLTTKNEIELTRQLEETNTKIKKLEDRFAAKEDQLKQELKLVKKDLELTKNKERVLLARLVDEENRKIKELGDRLASKEDQIKKDLQLTKQDLELTKNRERELLIGQLDEANRKNNELEDQLATKEAQFKKDLQVASKDLELTKNKELELTRQLDEANRRIEDLKEEVDEQQEIALALNSELEFQQDLHEEARKREQKHIQQLARLETRLELTERKRQDPWDASGSPSPF